jgi:tRNA threonylcarbamoyladenosine biosynthesis protein TsaE
MSGLEHPALQLALPNEVDTLELGGALARSLPRGLHDARVLYLQGELGSGKTTLARALLRALGEQGTVRSPSYTLLESYELPGWQVLHLDLYRLREAAELEHLALRDELRAGVLLLVEWPERAPRGLPEPDLRIGLGAGGEETAREAQLRAETPAGRRWLAELGTGYPPRTDHS